jgi:hypothetical protein
MRDFHRIVSQARNLMSMSLMVCVHNTGMNLSGILADSARAGMKLQRSDGSFPSGHNGPWNDVETPIRTTANWANLLLYMHGQDGAGQYRSAAAQALDFILGPSCKEAGRPFRCREGKDPPNGLIGQAWALDALLEGSARLREKRYLRAAEDVILLHQFDEKRGLWHNAGIDGLDAGANNTLNQQVWFASVAQKAWRMGGNETIRLRTESFFRRLKDHVRFDGKTIAHHINPVTEILMPRQSDGYLSFLLLGLANAHREDAGLIEERVLDCIPACLEHLNKSVFQGTPDYAWSYNPTGFEVAQVIEEFGLESDISPERWAAEQIRRAYDFGSSMLTKDTGDPQTLSSRICEACGLPDYEI